MFPLLLLFFDINLFLYAKCAECAQKCFSGNKMICGQNSRHSMESDDFARLDIVGWDHSFSAIGITGFVPHTVLKK